MTVSFFFTSADRWLPHLLPTAMSNSLMGQPRRAVILFFFSFQTDCVALGVWGTSGMKLWAGKLIMPPCMAELVNTKLSLRLILPRGRKTSQIPYLFLFALGVEAFWCFASLRKQEQISGSFWKLWDGALGSGPQHALLIHSSLTSPSSDELLGLESDKLGFISAAATPWCDVARGCPDISGCKQTACPPCPSHSPAIWAQWWVTRIVSLPHFTDPETETQPGAWYGQHGVTSETTQDADNQKFSNAFQWIFNLLNHLKNGHTCMSKTCLFNL